MYISHRVRSALASVVTATTFFSLIPIASAAIVSGPSSTADNTGDGASMLTINKPNPTSLGDILIAEISFDKGASTTVATPSGWTLIRRTDNGKKVGLASYWRLVGVSEPASYTWGISPQRTAVGGIVSYSGVLRTNPIDTTSDATGHSDTASAPSVTTSVSDEQVLAAFAVNDNRALATSAGMTEKFDVSNPDTNGPASSIDDMMQSAIGQVAPSSVFIDAPIRQWVAQQIALRPAPPFGTLQITKIVTNDNLGTSTASAFSFQVNGGTTTPFNVDGVNNLILSPGVYSVTETPTNRYAAAYSNCTSVTISGGATTTCAITNDDIPGALLTVRSIIVGGTAVPSDFALSVGSTTVQSGEQNLFPTGNYTVTESGPGGYRTVFGGDCDQSGGVTLGLNETKTCTITYVLLENTLPLCTDGIDNDQDSTTDLYDSDCQPFMPRLNVTILLINDNGGTAGRSFNLSAALFAPVGNLPGGLNTDSNFGYEFFNEFSSFTLNPGSYHVNPQIRTEAYQLGYHSAVSSDCSGTINPGEVKTCTITFDDVQPLLTVIKHVNNNNGGTVVASDFTMSVTGTNVSTSTFAGSETGTTVGLNPGAYTVTDSGPSGYIESFSGDCSGSISFGGTKTCTITSSQIETTENTLPLCTDSTDNDQDGTTDLYDSDCQPFMPRLTVIIALINDNGGTAGRSFNLSAALFAPVGDLPGGLNTDSNFGYEFFDYSSSFTLNTGSYHVNPQIRTSAYQQGYGSTASAECSGNIAPGEVKTCTITFDDIAPQLTVVKHVVNSSSGSAIASDFTMSVTGTNVSTSTFTGSEGGTTVTLNQGSYSVSDSGPSGYIESLSSDCSGSIGLGETKTCTITSSDIELVENTLPLCTDSTDNDQDGTTDLYDSDCQPFMPRLNVLIPLINDDGGTAERSFRLSAALFAPVGDLPGSEQTDSNFGYEFFNESSSFALNPGSYHVNPQIRTEAYQLGYHSAVSSDCSGTINPGDVKTCTITFDDVAPTLTVTKQVVNNNGGNAVASDFTMLVGGTNVSMATFPGSVSGTTITLNAGSYSVTESGPYGYTILTGTNCSGSLALGETRTCGIINDDIPPALTLLNAVVNDNAGTATTTDWTLTADGPTPISGAGSVTSETTNGFLAGTYTLSESGPAGYTASQWSCVGDVTNIGDTISLDIGQNATCTITNDDNP